MRWLPKRKGEWALVCVHLPGQSPEPIGILLSDIGDELHCMFRNDWSQIVSDTDELEIWRELATDLQRKAREHGATYVLDFLEEVGSYAVQIGTRQTVEFRKLQGTLEKLFEKHVAPRRQQLRYRTSPSYRVCAAAAATMALAIFIGKRQFASNEPPPLFDSTIYRVQALPLLRPSPYILALNPELTRNPSAPRRRWSQSRRANMSHRRRQLQLQSVVFNFPVRRAVTFDAPPLLLHVTEPAPQPLLLCFSLPEPPAFHSHRTRFVHALAALAVPFKWLFTHRDQTSDSL